MDDSLKKVWPVIVGGTLLTSALTNSIILAAAGFILLIYFGVKQSEGDQV